MGIAARRLSARTGGLVQAGLLAAPLAYRAVRLAGSHYCIVAAPLPCGELEPHVLLRAESSDPATLCALLISPRHTKMCAKHLDSIFEFFKLKAIYPHTATLCALPTHNHSPHRRSQIDLALSTTLRSARHTSLDIRKAFALRVWRASKH